MAGIEQLKVTSRTSSFFFKDRQMMAGEIGQQLGVKTIMEGSVRISGKALRVTAQLINVAEDTQIWSAVWNRELDNIFEVQDEISLLIADQLREEFGHLNVADRLVVQPTSDLEAYEYVLKGKFYFNKWNPADVNQSIILFEAAISRDPQLIDGHLALADAYGFLGTAGFLPYEESWQKAMESIQQASLIDEENAALNYQLANQVFFTEADYGKAFAHTLRAVVRRPAYPEARLFMVFLFLVQGDFKQAHRHLQYVRAVDPMNPEMRFYQAFFWYRSGEYQAAINECDELLTENPKNLPASTVRAYALLMVGAYGRLFSILADIPDELMMPDEKLGLTCLAHKMKGDDAGADLMRELEANAAGDTSFQAHAYLFMVCAVTGKNDQAFAILDKLFSVKSSILLLSFNDPLAAKLRQDERFAVYQQKIYVVTNASEKPNKPRSAPPDPATVQLLLYQLMEFMVQESPYLNPSLTLRLLASQIETLPNQLSWLLNNRVGKNYNEFINGYRVEHFKKLVVDSANAHISMIGLAYESGFNSKTVFNTVFKKMVGMTPNEYKKSTDM
ncbi:MAG: adenylate cyclase [Neolewinella sp.]